MTIIIKRKAYHDSTLLLIKGNLISPFGAVPFQKEIVFFLKIFCLMIFDHIDAVEMLKTNLLVSQ